MELFKLATLCSRLVLPGILEQVVSCRDAIAQEYLMECIIQVTDSCICNLGRLYWSCSDLFHPQVFPDEFHLACLTSFLEACAELQPAVNVKNIVIALIDRLAQFATREDSGGIPPTIQLFQIFSDEISSIIKARPDMPPEDIVSLEVSLMNLAHKCYQERIDMIDTVLANTKDLFANVDISVVEHRTPVGRELEKLLKIPVDSYNDIMVVLALEHFIPLLNCYDYSGRKEMSAYLVNNVIDNATLIPSPEKVETILTIVAPLVADQTDGPGAEQSRAEDKEEWEEEQALMGRLVHLLQADTPDQQYLVLTAARKHLSAGGPLRLPYTLPPLVFEAYQLARRFHTVRQTDDKWDPKVEKIFKFCHSTVSALVKAEMAELPLRLFLQGALACNSIPFSNHESVAYEYMSQAFSLYEDEISDSRAQLAAITLIIATFQQMSCFSEENHDPLRSQCALAAAKLLKKPDQCRGVLAVSHLFWSGASKATEGKPTRDGKKVVDCLKKGLKIAKQCMDPGVQVQLLVEILNHYVLFYEAGNAQISVDMIKEIVALVQGELGGLEAGDESEQIGQHFRNSLLHMKVRRDAEGSGLYPGVDL